MADGWSTCAKLIDECPFNGGFIAFDLERVDVAFPILKFDKNADGDIVVYGKCTDGTVDSDDQIVDPDWSGKAIQEWLSTGGNLRVQHSPYLYPAGRGIDTETKSDGHYITALIVEPTAKKLVEKGVLRSFSVGISRPTIVRDNVAKGGRITGGKLIEISLVDRPANANCQFNVVKSEGDAPVDTEELMGHYQDLIAKFDAQDAETDQFASYAEARADLLVKVTDVAELGFIAKSTGLDGTAEGMELWLGKRNMDPGVGNNGADRDKLDASDFAGPNRTFPIVTQSDVSDAASLLHHAADPSAVKQRIVAIARRKGFKLPATWGDSTKGGSVDTDTAEAAPEVAKGQKDCKSCGKNYDADSKQRNCEGCGADLPHADGSGGESDSDSADKGRHDARHPETGKFVPATDSKPTPDGGHAEPDGDEAGPDVDGDGDGTTNTAKHHSADDMENGGTGLAQHKGAEKLPYSMRRLHDLMCAAYSQDTLRDEYASVKSFTDALDVDEAVKFVGEEWREELTLMKGVDSTAFIDALTSNSNAFSQYYPDTNLTPGSISPGQFNRPYVTTGRAREVAAIGGANPAGGGRQAEANDFDRGPLTAGREDDSPANKSSNSSMADMYANASASYLKNRLQALHDKISHGHPNVCALSSQVQFQDNRQNAGLTPRTDGVTGVAPGEKSSTSDIIKSAVDSAVAKVREDYDSQLAELQKQLTELGSQPDLSQAPVRGALANRVAEGDKAAPVARKSLVAETHEKVTTETDEDLKLYEYAQKMAQSGDPNMRKQAEQVIKGLLTSPSVISKLQS